MIELEISLIDMKMHQLRIFGDVDAAIQKCVSVQSDEFSQKYVVDVKT